MNQSPEIRWFGRLARLNRVLAAVFLTAAVAIPSAGGAIEIPRVQDSLNDLAGMIPQASADELRKRLGDFDHRTGRRVIVLTMPDLGADDIDTFGRRVFEQLPRNERGRSILLVVSRRDHRVGLQIGAELAPLFPEPIATEKVRGHVDLYSNGLRPDLGIHAGVNYIFRILKGEVRAEQTSETERLENASLRGAGAGAIFAVFLAPYLAFLVGGLWGFYASNIGIQSPVRLFVGAVLGSGTAKIIATLTSMLGSYSDGLWYFILALSIPLSIFGSLTEFWMSGDWIGIPREKDAKLRRKPTEKMGI